MTALLSLTLSLSLFACTEVTPVDHEEETATTDACDSLDAVNWSEASHAKGVDGDYALIMGLEEVPRLDITICPEDYADMQADLESLYGGDGGGGGGPGGGGPPSFSDEDPIYVPVNVGFDGRTWPSVGMRYKGNSSLMSAYQDGSGKLPFRLGFDKYEDEVPEVEDQRFHGFKDLKFSSAHKDESLMRDKLAADTFRDAGVPAAMGGFVRIYVDAGDGPEYWGLYTMFEDPAGELLDSWFGDDSGNAYKPDGTTATLDGFDEDDFEQKTNEGGDYADVKALVELLADDRSGATWRSELEAVFEVDAFLRYLALNNLIGNWDSYGNMTHNYYLYGDPAVEGRLTWIPWDFNESYGTSGVANELSIGMDEVGTDWPLIRRLMDDGVYVERYAEHLEDLMDGAYSVEAQSDRVAEYELLIAEWAEAEEEPYTNQPGSFDTSSILDRVDDARDDAADWLADN